MAHKPGAVHIGEEGSNTYAEFPTFPTIRGKGPEFKGRIKLPSSDGFEDLVTQFESEENKAWFGKRKTVRQDVDDYQGHGPGTVIYQDKTNAGPAGMYFIPSNTEYNKGLAKDVNDLNNVISAAQTILTLGVATKGAVRQRNQQRIQHENLAFEGATNITPKGPSNVTGATTKGDIKPGTIFKDGVPVSPGYEVGYKSYLEKGGNPKNYGIAQNVKMELNIAKSIVNGEPIPRPNLKPFRDEPHTAILSQENYIQKWANYPDHSGQGWRDFQKEHGIFITNQGYKLKPPGKVNRTNRIRTLKKNQMVEKIEKEWSPSLTVKMDASIHKRNMRADLATYIFGGTPLSLDQAKRDAKKIGNIKYEPHHRTGMGEISPWLDIIIEKLQQPKGSKAYQEGFELMELTKDVIRRTDHYAGDVKENYSLLQHEDHVGPHGIHTRMGWKKDEKSGEQLGYQVTGPSGKPSFDFKTISKGVGGMPTAEYLKTLPTSREDTLKYVTKFIEKGKVKKKYIKGGELTMEGNTFVNTLVEWLNYSNIVKDYAHEELRKESTSGLGPNWAKGEK